MSARNSFRLASIVALGLIGSLATVAAQAASQTIASAGSLLAPGALTLSGQLAFGGDSTAGAAATGTNPTLDTVTGGSYFYGDSFAVPTGGTAPVASSALAGSSTGSGFHDAFAFTVGGATASSITATFDLGSLLGISGLAVRLYSAAVGSLAPALGDPASFFLATTAGNTATLGAVSLLPGTYVLEVRGLVTGTQGGSYAGVLNVAPVPLPAALPLLLSGLAAAGVFRRRRRDGAPA